MSDRLWLNLQIAPMLGGVFAIIMLLIWSLSIVPYILLDFLKGFREKASRVGGFRGYLKLGACLKVAATLVMSVVIAIADDKFPYRILDSNLFRYCLFFPMAGIVIEPVLYAHMGNKAVKAIYVAYQALFVSILFLGIFYAGQSV